MTRQFFAVLFSLVTAAAGPSWLAALDQARWMYAAGDYRGAETLFRTVLDELRRNAPQDPKIPEILNDLGANCHLLGRYAEAESLYQGALRAWRANPAPPTDVLA